MASATILDAKELNEVVRLVKDKRLLYAPIKGVPRLMGFPDAAKSISDEIVDGYDSTTDRSSASYRC